jgi:hypothetical protein
MTNINPIINLDISDISDNLICSICQDNLDEKAVFLDCSHMFHHECIMNWYNQNNQTKNKCCPLCRKDIIIDIELNESIETTPLIASQHKNSFNRKFLYGLSGVLCILTTILLLNIQINIC